MCTRRKQLVVDSMLICSLGLIIAGAARFYSTAHVLLFLAAIIMFPYIAQRLAGGIDKAELKLSCICGSRALALQVTMAVLLFHFSPLSFLSIWAAFAFTFILMGMK